MRFPSTGSTQATMGSDAKMLEAKGLSFCYDPARMIVEGFDLAVEPGERVALSAPSGFGKTTVCRLLAGYESPAEGKVLVDGRELPRKGVCPVQLVQQHPELAVDPRRRMEDTLREAGDVPDGLLERFGVQHKWMRRFPHELSGGELQRFCIVRALAVRPRYLVADEISTMLDALTQAQIWHALMDEAESRNMGMVIVSHSPALTERVATRTVALDDDCGARR